MSDGLDLEIGTITLTEYDEGALKIQIDGAGDGATVTSFDTELPYGFFCRPRDPDPGINGATGPSCNALFSFEGDRGHVWVGPDPRIVYGRNIPTSPKGSVGLCALRDDKVGDTQLVSFLRLSGENGTFRVSVPGKDGHDSYLELSEDGGLDVKTKWCRITAGPMGIHLVHNSGARLDLGSIGGIPGPPFNALTSYATLVGGMATIKGGVVNMGSDGGLANELGVTALAALLVAVNTASVALGAVVASLTTVSGVTPPQQAAVAAAVTALTTANTAAQLAIHGIGKAI